MPEQLHSFVATNPCHVYDLALALHEQGRLGCYYSGYPGWRLRPPGDFPLQVRSWRTVLTYAMQRLPERYRIRDDRMFRWQDAGFDREVAAALRGGGYLHGLPGQCLATFRRARELGFQTVLNHASGPLPQQRRWVAPEYARAGQHLDAVQPLPAGLQERLEVELQLADFHCVASSVVRDQLLADGIAREKIWIVPYGADERLFAKREVLPSGPFRIGFVARQSLRKGVYYLLKALEQVAMAEWELHCIGMPLRETAADFAGYSGSASLIQHGNLSQQKLAGMLRKLDVLVLPSVEEAFGLVVVQALSCGLPCIVSDRVGAKDLIRDGETGTIFEFGNIAALCEAILRWSTRRITVQDCFPWSYSALELMRQSALAAASTSSDR